MSDETRKRIQFYLQVGVIAIIPAISTWFTAMGRIESAHARVDRLERDHTDTRNLVTKMGMDVEVTKLNVEVTKTNVQWIKETLEKGRK